MAQDHGDAVEDDHIEQIEAVREKLLEVHMDDLPPSVRERFSKGEHMILDALGEAEALAGRE